MDFGRAIRIIRAARGYSQKELAQRSGCDASYISLLEGGSRTPSMKTLGQLSEAFGIPPELMMLLASDDKSLRGISAEDAHRLGLTLLRVLTDTRDDAG